MISIIIPTYNECENIKGIITKIQAVMQSEMISYEILIIDDNSPDGTSDVVKKIIKSTKCNTDQNIRLYTRLRKEGIGSAYKYGFKKAKGTYLMEMDADFSHDPKEIMCFMKAMENGSDVVIGSRFIRGGERNDAYVRKIFPIIGSMLYKFFLKSNVRDITSGYRLYKKSAINKVNLDVLPDDFSFQVAILFEFIDKKCNIREIPIIFSKRRAGRPKYSTNDLIGNIKMLMKLYIRRLLKNNQY